MKNRKEKNVRPKENASLKSIQRLFVRAQLVLITVLTLILGVSGTMIHIHYETEQRDKNLQNVAEAIAHFPMQTESEPMNDEESAALCGYLDTLMKTLDDIDVISVVNRDGMRVYHSSHDLIGTQYDGTLPDFETHSSGYYTTDETGPSGNQRRAYAAIYDTNGAYNGFVMAIMLMENIQTQTAQMLMLFFCITLAAVCIELLVARSLSKKIKKSLMGYEPDVFTAMYRMRDNILETLEEGILAFDSRGVIQFANEAAVRMLCDTTEESLVGRRTDEFHDEVFKRIMQSENKESNISLSKGDIILDRVPIKENGEIVGAVAVLHNRAEYTKLMEDLSGTRYLIDSMRANNHDFTNKLHVILGLIQMKMYDEASAYIQNITMVQRENISKVMNAVSEPAVAALLIGKIAAASEVNVHFVLREGCCYSASDLKLPSEMLVTVIGNLVDNALEAMNTDDDYKTKKELMLGIYSRPGAVLITVDDTGRGISAKEMDLIFQNGYSTKGEGRGTGLYQVKAMVENYGGKITVESQEGVGSSFSVSFAKE